MNIGDNLRSTAESVSDAAPHFMLFIAILIVGWLLAGLLRKLVRTLLDKTNVDAVAGRRGMGRLLGNYRLSQFVVGLAYYATLLLTLQLAFGIFGPNPVSHSITDLVAFLPQLLVAFLIVGVAGAVSTIVHSIISAAGLSCGPVLARSAQMATLVFGVIAALHQIGVAATVTMPVLITVLATAGAILAIGVGGGLVKPMQQRWERILTRGETEARRLPEPYEEASSHRDEHRNHHHHPTTPLQTIAFESGQYAPRDDVPSLGR